MSKKGPHKHSHNLAEEVLIARLFWIIIVGLFFLEVFLKLSDKGLVSMRIFEEGGFTLMGQAMFDFWSQSLQPIFLVLNVLSLGIFIFAVIKVWPIRQTIAIFHNPHAHGGGHGTGHGAEHGTPVGPVHNPMILKHWTDIVRRANTGTPENLRWAIMEADALVDTVLKERQMPGETMADRLANFRREDSKHIDKLWDAHRLRNEIAHTPGFAMTTRQAEKALFTYRDFLKELKAF